MRLLPVVKGTLQKFKSRSKNEDTPNEENNGFHQTPAGEFPRNGPRSSIVALIMFYLSKIITIVGLILVAREVWFEEVSLIFYHEQSTWSKSIILLCVSFDCCQYF